MKYQMVRDQWEFLESVGHDPFSISKCTDSNRKRREILRRVIVGDLTEKQKKCLSLYYGAGWSVAQIASAMGITKGSVSKILKRARQRIKKHLEYAGEKGSLHFFD